MLKRIIALSFVMASVSACSGGGNGAAGGGAGLSDIIGLGTPALQFSPSASPTQAGDSSVAEVRGVSEAFRNTTVSTAHERAVAAWESSIRQAYGFTQAELDDAIANNDLDNVVAQRITNYGRTYPNRPPLPALSAFGSRPTQSGTPTINLTLGGQQYTFDQNSVANIRSAIVDNDEGVIFISNTDNFISGLTDANLTLIWQLDTEKDTNHVNEVSAADNSNNLSGIEFESFQFVQTSQNATPVANLPSASVDYAGIVQGMIIDRTSTQAPSQTQYYNNGRFTMNVDFNTGEITGQAARDAQLGNTLGIGPSVVLGGTGGAITGNLLSGNSRNQFTAVYETTHQTTTGQGANPAMIRTRINGGFFGDNAAEVSAIGRSEPGTGTNPDYAHIVGFIGCRTGASCNVALNGQDAFTGAGAVIGTPPQAPNP